jgi:hypothetical protein
MLGSQAQEKHRNCPPEAYPVNNADTLPGGPTHTFTNQKPRKTPHLKPTFRPQVHPILTVPPVPYVPIQGLVSFKTGRLIRLPVLFRAADSRRSLEPGGGITLLNRSIRPARTARLYSLIFGGCLRSAQLIFGFTTCPSGSTAAKSMRWIGPVSVSEKTEHSPWVFSTMYELRFTR